MISLSLYKSFKCDSVIYDCSFFFGFSKDSREITQDEPATNPKILEALRFGTTRCGYCDLEPLHASVERSEARNVKKWMFPKIGVMDGLYL